MYEIGEHYHGFCLERRERVEEIQSDALIFRHQKTGAELVVLENEDDNKVFMISFRTPVTDSTGVPHILEHSVLNGSRKYPVKEPFLELIKGSLYTFLNAMTYPDKTVYPVASRNHEDFDNLVDVYLDAVFHPLISNETFLQEGWHYHLESPQDDLTYSGVVYNEMLGAYSDPESVLNDELEQALFPDSSYAHSSGGDPAAIPELTYQQFTDFHTELYHPSNSRIVLYGDVDLEQRLQHLASYLDAFEARDVNSTIIEQPRFTAPVQRRGTYPISPEDDPAGNTYALRAWMLGSPTDPDYLLSMSVLAHILCGTQASPLRKALIDSHLGEDCLSYGLEEDLQQMNFAIGLRGTDPDKAEAMEAVIDETLAKLVADGIDPRMIESSLNTIEFSLREANFGGYPKGLVYALQMHRSWLYGGDPLSHLAYEPVLARLKEKLAAGRYFEQLIQQELIDNPHRATVVLEPDPEQEAKRRQELAAKLASRKDLLSGGALQALVNQCEELKQAQLTPDSPEALDSIPRLSLSAVDRQAEDYAFELIDEAPVALSFSEQPTNGIVYVQLAFNTEAVPQELLPYLKLYARSLMQTGTTSRDYVALTQDIGIHTGGISAAHLLTGLYEAPDAYRGDVFLSAKALTSNVPTLMELLADIVLQPNLEDHQRLAEILQITRAKMQASIVPSGHSYVSRRLSSYFHPMGQYSERAGGLEQFLFLEQLSHDLQETPELLGERLRQIHEHVMTRGNLHLHVTGEAAELAAVREQLDRFADGLPAKSLVPVDYDFGEPTPDEGFSVPSKIQYVGKGIRLYDHGLSYSGQLEVLKKLLSRDYLWNTVRVQGNAYGCFASLDIQSGVLSCISYRDPHLSRTLETFDAFGDYLQNLQISREEFEKLIIGTIGSIDSPKTPDQKGSSAFARYRSGLRYETIQRWREEILDCTAEDMNRYVSAFRLFAQKGRICVVGGGEKLQGAADRFSRLQPIFSRSQTAALPAADD